MDVVEPRGRFRYPRTENKISALINQSNSFSSLILWIISYLQIYIRTRNTIRISFYPSMRYEWPVTKKKRDMNGNYSTRLRRRPQTSLREERKLLNIYLRESYIIVA